MGLNGCSWIEHDRPRPKGLHFIVKDDERECNCINENMNDNDNYINNKLTIKESTIFVLLSILLSTGITVRDISKGEKELGII